LKAETRVKSNRRQSRLGRGLWAAALAISLAPTASAQTPVEPTLPTEFYDVITVDVFTVVARIIDSSGKPLPGIGPGDLIATVGGRELPVAAVDWHGTPLDERDTREAGRSRTGAPPGRPLPGALDRIEAEGRRVVIFLQNDFEPTRVAGQTKLLPPLRRLVDNLGPKDRVAVLSFYAHLKLWQDFTTDKAAVKASLHRAFFPGARPGKVEPSESPSLLDTFDAAEARDVSNPIGALRYTAEALAPLPGEKDIIFFGYGLDGAGLESMLHALQSAHATTFIVDTTQAEWHTLGITLETTARATGGTYGTSEDFAQLALARIGRLLAGHYVVTIDRSDAAEARGRLELRLRDGPGTILIAPTRVN
jgi:hypothetical protein